MRVSSSGATSQRGGLASTFNGSRQRLAADCRALIGDAEELLRVTADYSGESLAAARARVEEGLNQLKHSLQETGGNVWGYPLDRYRNAVRATHRYAHDNPWRFVGVAMVVGTLVGFLAKRR